MNLPEPQERSPSRYEARRAVYSALTSDLGADHRDPQDTNFLALDLDGVLHVRHVDRFVDALLAWKESLRTAKDDPSMSRMRDFVAKSRGEK